VNTALLDEIVNAVLYEGYILDPCRASSKTNCHERFTFGRVYPQQYSIAQNCAEPCLLQTQCLAHADKNDANIEVTVRFLQPTAREPENGWQRATERAVTVNLALPGKLEQKLTFDELAGYIEVTAETFEAFYIITIRIHNTTPVPEAELTDSKAIRLRTFASTHTILHIEGGRFISAVEPISAVCKNIGTWPVLVGNEHAGERDTMLSSSIILADYPKIAPESAGTLFAGTEIDEILTLRIMTMTDKEKQEMCHVEAYARQLLERTEVIPQKRLLKSHRKQRESALL
jgi:hydrogenase maturation protease